MFCNYIYIRKRDFLDGCCSIFKSCDFRHMARSRKDSTPPCLAPFRAAGNPLRVIICTECGVPHGLKQSSIPISAHCRDDTVLTQQGEACAFAWNPRVTELTKIHFLIVTGIINSEGMR